MKILLLEFRVDLFISIIIYVICTCHSVLVASSLSFCKDLNLCTKYEIEEYLKSIDIRV